MTSNSAFNEVYNIVALGCTGVGKSAFLNMIMRRCLMENGFEEGDTLFSQTQITTSKLVQFKDKEGGFNLRLVDTQGLSDTSGDKTDMEHIKNMVETIRKLNSVDLFLICLDGTNLRFTPYIQETIRLFHQIFPDFFYHSVLIFNKWTSPDMVKLNKHKKEYQEMFKEKYNAANMPCYFIDSYYNLKMLRDNQDGTQSIRELHPNIQARTDAQIIALMTFMVLKESNCNVSSIQPKDTLLTTLGKEREAVEEQLRQTILNNQNAINSLRLENEQRISDVNSINEARLNALRNQLTDARRRRGGNKCLVV
jgi:tRNA U34 5-carboxymethylaminomethyl modifying GTPase MnmE/TrmE